MNKRTVALISLAAVGSLLLGAPAQEGGTRSGASAKGAVIHVCQDEAEMERAIAAYIAETHGIHADLNEIEDIPGDIYLEYVLGDGPAPKLPVYVDTAPSAHETETGRVSERCVRIHACLLLPKAAKTSANRLKILELNNTWHREKWTPGRLYLDEDGDLVLETFLNVPGPKAPLQAEMVFDMLQRMAKAWQEYYERLKRTVPVEEQRREAPSTSKAGEPTEMPPAAPGTQ